jgi:hypothetical protein
LRSCQVDSDGVRRLISSRANRMCRASSTTWIWLVARVSGWTRSSFIRSRWKMSRISSATRIAAYADGPSPFAANAFPSRRIDVGGW